MGNVQRPGAFSLSGREIDVRQAIAAAGGFGPLANGYASLAVGGNVGVGGSATVITHLIWRNQSGTVLRTNWDSTTTYLTGTFSDILTTSRALNSPLASLPAGSKLRLNGFVEFQASNLSLRMRYPPPFR